MADDSAASLLQCKRSSDLLLPSAAFNQRHPSRSNYLEPNKPVVFPVGGFSGQHDLGPPYGRARAVAYLNHRLELGPIDQAHEQRDMDTSHAEVCLICALMGNAGQMGNTSIRPPRASTSDDFWTLCLTI